jgi:hypothetical protein
MKRNLTFTVVSSLMMCLCSCHNPENSREPVKIIFDTDLGPDYDDVGALAFLHAMADSGKVEILATVSSNKHELVAPSINVLNTWDQTSIGPIRLLLTILMQLNRLRRCRMP